MNTEQIVDLIVRLAAVIIPIAVAALVPLAKRYIASLEAVAKARLGEQQYWFAQTVVQQIVEGVEQSVGLTKYDGEQKKEAALILLSEICMMHEIPLSIRQLETLIEAAVKAMNGKDKSRITINGSG